MITTPAPGRDGCGWASFRMAIWPGRSAALLPREYKKPRLSWGGNRGFKVASEREGLPREVTLDVCP
jgi:hypothetical protein